MIFDPKQFFLATMQAYLYFCFNMEIINSCLGWMWLIMPLIPVLRWQRQEDIYGFKANMVYTAGSRLAKIT